jgi:hypothetical protein
MLSSVRSVKGWNTCRKGINSSKSKPAPKDGTDAVHAISSAIVIMAKIYKENKIPLQLAREGATI